MPSILRRILLHPLVLHPLVLQFATGGLACQERAVVELHPAAELAREDRAELPKGQNRRVFTLGSAAHFANRFIQPRLLVGEEIKPLGKRSLVAVMRPAQHRWLRRFIKTNSELGTYAMDIQCLFIRTDAKTFDRHVKPLFAKGGKRRPHVVLASGKKTEKYLSDLRSMRGATVLAGPRLLALPAQRATLSIMNQITYVKDFTTEFDEKGKLKSVDPVIGVVQDGTMLDSLCGLVRPNTVGLSLRAVWSSMDKPIKEVEVHFKECATSIKLQVPTVKVAEIRSDVEMPLGGTVMFELPKTKWPHMIVFVTVNLRKM